MLRANAETWAHRDMPGLIAMCPRKNGGCCKICPQNLVTSRSARAHPGVYAHFWIGPKFCGHIAISPGISRSAQVSAFARNMYMYTNIPVDDAAQLLKSKLENSGKLSPREIDEIINLVNLVLKQNYFTHRDKFYVANNGVAMGNPLSATISQIVFNNFEEMFIMNECNPYFDRIKFYKRYVDDTFLIFQGSKRITQKFVEYLNFCHVSIKFTCEYMVDNSLVFLDLTVYLKQDNKLGFRIYRKPTTTDVIIPYNSMHPTSQKHAAIHAMAHRLYNIPMDKNDFNAELNTIYHICKVNGYPIYIVNNILAKHKSKNTDDDIGVSNQVQNHCLNRSNKDKKYRRLDFFNNSSYTIGNSFKKFGYFPAFSTSNKIYNKFQNNNKVGNRSDLNQSGVYKINCSDCNHIYVGKTERNFNTRFKEHLNSANSNVFKHLNESGHSVNIDDNLSVLHLSKDKCFLNVLERYEIAQCVKRGEPLLNIQLDIEASKNVLIDKCCCL